MGTPAGGGAAHRAVGRDRLAFWRKRAEREGSIESLLGVEGTAARDYFAHFALMFKTAGGERPPAFDFNARNRRPPRDPVNALLPFLYSMLAKEMLVALVGGGFDPYQGFYHQPRYGRPALALDLMEEFRPLVADSVVIGLNNNGEVRPSDFISRAGAVAMTRREEARARSLRAPARYARSATPCNTPSSAATSHRPSASCWSRR